METAGKNPRAIREAKSTIDIKPTGENVIIKIVGEFMASNVLLSEETKTKDLFRPHYVEVVAYGDETYGFEIGDKVILDANSRPSQPIFVKGNTKSIASVAKEAKALVGANGQIASGNKEVIEYALVSMYDIRAIDNTDYSNAN